MGVFAKILDGINSFTDKSIEFIGKKISGKVCDFLLLQLNKFYAPLILITIVLFLLNTLKLGFIYFLLSLIFAVPILLIFNYIGEKFHGACNNLISANKTGLSDDAILRLLSISYILGGIFFFLLSVLLSANSSLLYASDFGFGGYILPFLLVGLWILSLIHFLATVPIANPDLINVEISKDNTSAEDAICILTLPLKIMLYFEELTSRLLIVSSAFLFIRFLLSSSAFSDFMMLGYAFTFLCLGLAYPLVIYFVFLMFNFWFSFMLSILGVAKNISSGIAGK
ncbi:MAG: hypothetical protein VX794_03430 [Nitrospinota bacterium]|nr:hypothetical protein [Nitrospinota bacterium]